MQIDRKYLPEEQVREAQLKMRRELGEAILQPSAAFRRAGEEVDAEATEEFGARTRYGNSNSRWEGLLQPIAAAWDRLAEVEEALHASATDEDDVTPIFPAR